MPSVDFFPILAPEFVLRKLETYFVYNIRDDELYELDEEAFEFLRKCDGETPFSKLIIDLGEECQESIHYMNEEGIILMKEFPGKRMIRVEQSPLPSLRYLLFNITDKCNLECKHCYLGKSGSTEIGIDLIEKAVSNFARMGGMKLMISGGEPLLHSKFWELMEVLKSCELRIVILSNGTLVNDSAARKLSGYVDEVQISIDGIRSHDIIRGRNTYDKAIAGVRALKNHNIPVSIATMVHRCNTGEFDEMQRLFSELKVFSWSVDVPCTKGNLLDNQDLTIALKDAALFLKYGYGGGTHESTGNFTCGSHMCAVAPDGSVSKCGFFEDEPAGDVNNLNTAWANLCKDYLWRLDELECRDCKVIQDCRGGCRFRARQYQGRLGPDPLFCHANNVLTYLR
jgi:radical SAM protein with 4Fe4S-binding SPASM domain